MKKLLLVAALALSLAGCSFIKESVQNGKDCWNDPICRQEAITEANSAKLQITQAAAVASPLPWVPVVAGTLGGGIVLAVKLVLGGRKKKELAPAA